MVDYTPPFEITDKIISLLVDIGSEVGRLDTLASGPAAPYLRRSNRIRTVQASLAIEQNTLTLEQVTAVIEGKQVNGPAHEITEVQNAFKVYEDLGTFDPFSSQSILKAHRLLTEGLVDSAGKWRQGGVGVVKGKEVLHLAPPAENVPYLMAELLFWLQRTEAHPLIVSSVFHYELEFIHPFADGNGRMGRLWQTLILSRWNPLFSWLPVETIVRDHQQQYHDILAYCDKAGISTLFIEFMLGAVLETCGGVSGGVKSLDERILLLLSSTENPLRVSNMLMQLDSSQRSLERAIQRLRKTGQIVFVGAPKTGGYIVVD